VFNCDNRLKKKREFEFDLIVSILWGWVDTSKSSFFLAFYHSLLIKSLKKAISVIYTVYFFLFRQDGGEGVCERKGE